MKRLEMGKILDGFLRTVPQVRKLKQKELAKAEI